MEATMTQTRSHTPVGFGADFVRQFRFLWTCRRPLFLAVALLAGLALAGDPWLLDSKMRLLSFWPVWLLPIGPLWAFIVFHNEGPENRYYFWSGPVQRTGHTLARLAAGAAWLWLIYVGLILVGGLIGLLDGDAWQLAEIGFIGWVNFFTGPLLGYLAVSLLTIPSDYPIRWTVAILFAFPMVVVAMVEWLGLERLTEWLLQPLINEQWGLGVTMVGGMAESVTELETTLRTMQDPAYQPSGEFTAAGDWWLSTPMWIAFFVALVVLVARIHPDRFPRLRLRRD